MAEEAQQQDRTEQPTPKRRADARKKGDVPRSRELTMTGVMSLRICSPFSLRRFVTWSVTAVFPAPVTP